MGGSRTYFPPSLHSPPHLHRPKLREQSAQTPRTGEATAGQERDGANAVRVLLSVPQTYPKLKNKERKTGEAEGEGKEKDMSACTD